MNQAQVLLEKALDLLSFCNSKKEFDQKLFGIKLKNFTDLYKRCDNSTQSLYHELWKESIDEA